jgi:hypothetical protein
MTTTIDQLSKRIEKVIQEHLAASQRAAADAMARTFGIAGGAVRRERLAARPARHGRRRRAELAELGEKFYHAVCAKPGETMAVLAAELGSTPRELNRPMTELKRVGQVRTVGHSYFTRYFPMAQAKS